MGRVGRGGWVSGWSGWSAAGAVVEAHCRRTPPAQPCHQRAQGLTQHLCRGQVCVHFHLDLNHGNHARVAVHQLDAPLWGRQGVGVGGMSSEGGVAGA